MLIDPPAWPAWGRLWSHLVSDHSLAELHAFAASVDLPPRSFEGDHYDVPEERYAPVVSAGAVPVGSRELLARLRASGLRRPKRRGERVLGESRAGGRRVEAVLSPLAPPDPTVPVTQVHLLLTWADQVLFGPPGRPEGRTGEAEPALPRAAGEQELVQRYEPLTAAALADGPGPGDGRVHPSRVGHLRTRREDGSLVDYQLLLALQSDAGRESGRHRPPPAPDDHHWVPSRGAAVRFGPPWPELLGWLLVGPPVTRQLAAPAPGAGSPGPRRPSAGAPPR